MSVLRVSASAAFFPFLAVACLHAQQEANTLTYHNNNSRTGVNAAETTLTLANVNSKTFGKLHMFDTDGVVDAQPLYVAGLKIAGTTRNVLFIATEHDTVYAFDAESGKVLWQKSLLNADETTSVASDCSGLAPEIGVMATPVIDLSKGQHGAIYVVNSAHHTNGNYHQRLNALDLTTGGQLFGGPEEITATFPGTGDNSSGGKVVFDPAQYSERTALLEWDGGIVTTWTSHCDNRPYTGWVMSFNAYNLKPKSVLDVTPNGNSGAIWMSGGGPAATSTEVFLMDGNGTFDTTLTSKGFPSKGDFGNAFIQLAEGSNVQLHVKDYYATDTTVHQSATDIDLGSGGVVLLPTLYDNSGNAHQLAVGAGKDMNIYVADRTNMGKYHPDGGSIYQVVPAALAGGEYGTPLYFDNKLYFGGLTDNIRAFSIKDAKVVATPASKTGMTFVYPGTTPTISANGTSNGILWALQHDSTSVLYAFDAEDLSKELYNSTQGTGGNFGVVNHFVTPLVANGRVYVPTKTGVAVFGLLGN